MLTAAAPGSKVLVDTRTAEDTRELFGGDYPGGVLYAPTPWVEANKDTTGKIATAVVETLHWIKDHSSAEIADKMSAEIVGSDKAAYISALDASRAHLLGNRHDRSRGGRGRAGRLRGRRS